MNGTAAPGRSFTSPVRSGSPCEMAAPKWILSDPDLAKQDSGSTSVVTAFDGTTPVYQRYKPFGETRLTNPLGTKYTFTGQLSHTDDFGLLFFNARWVDPQLARFAQADTLVPDAYNPQDYDRYGYMRSNPLRYIDPSGHCPGTPGDGVNDACWNYLTGKGSDSFCYGSGIDICGSGGWQRWFVLASQSCHSAHTCLPRFENPWSKSQLQTLRNAIKGMISAFQSINVDWMSTPLSNTKYMLGTKPLKTSWANPYTLVVHLDSVDEITIWHETAHTIDFGSEGRMGDLFAMYSGNCVDHGMGGIYCANVAKDGFYWRNYGRDAGRTIGYLYGALFNKHDTFADAFAAWVFSIQSKGKNPTNWVFGVTPSNQAIIPIWTDMYDAVIKSLNSVFK